jgi:hypothetical protein
MDVLTDKLCQNWTTRDWHAQAAYRLQRHLNSGPISGHEKRRKMEAQLETHLAELHTAKAEQATLKGVAQVIDVLDDDSF